MGKKLEKIMQAIRVVAPLLPQKARINFRSNFFLYCSAGPFAADAPFEKKEDLIYFNLWGKLHFFTILTHYIIYVLIHTRQQKMLIKIGVDAGTVSWEGLRSLTLGNLNDDIVQCNSDYHCTLTWPLIITVLTFLSSVT